MLPVMPAGAEPPDIEACLFFTLPFMPFYIPPYLFHLTRWVIENALLGREMSDGNTVSSQLIAMLTAGLGRGEVFLDAAAVWVDSRRVRRV